MSQHRAIPHKSTGSYSFAADLFRLEIQAAGLGLYVDCDCYCVRPVEDADYIYGWEDSQTLGTAVLKLPAGSELLADLRSIGMARAFVPPWARSGAKRRYRARAILGISVPVSEMEWGTLGPKALTYYAKKRSMDSRAQPPDTFYPLHWGHADLIRDPALRLEDLITPRTQILHLWNEALARAPGAAPHGSPLDILINE